MFREFARRVQAPLLANMTEFGRTPYFTAREFEAMGYRIVIWPVSDCASRPRHMKLSTSRSNATVERITS
jgi:methylisocitrate lyase